MSFQIVCDEDDFALENIDVFVGATSYSASIRIAECLETGRVLFVQASLTERSGFPAAGYPEMDFAELSFAVVVSGDWENEPNTAYFDPAKAAPFIPNGAKPLITKGAEQCYRALIGACNPRCVYRATYLMAPPEETLPKHQTLTQLIGMLGYRLEDFGTDADGRRYWVMVKQVPI